MGKGDERSKILTDERKGEASASGKSAAITFHVILMELGPVGVATTASGGPDGAASSVRKNMAFDASLQPTSFWAKTSARYEVSARNPVMLALTTGDGLSTKVSLVLGSLNLTAYLVMPLFPLKGSIQVRFTEFPVTFTTCK